MGLGVDPEYAREKLYELVSEGRLTLVDACRLMRAVTGMTQAEFARWVGVAERTYIDLERGAGNPTLATLNRIGAVFNLEVGFVWRRHTIALENSLGS